MCFFTDSLQGKWPSLESQVFNIERNLLVQYISNPVPSFINEKLRGLKRSKIVPKVTKLVEVLISISSIPFISLQNRLKKYFSSPSVFSATSLPAAAPRLAS